jgi:myo-inositol-1(or 4)-monophosphatase
VLREWLGKARAILAETRALIVNAFDRDFQYQRKADQSWVTEIDLAVERLMRARLAEQFPQHGVIGEEFSDQNRAGEYTWVVDPIDGTASLRHRVPLFGTLLALRHEERPVLGFIDLPMLGRLYSGGAGLGVWCNDRTLRIPDASSDFPESTSVTSDSSTSSEMISIGGRGAFVSAGAPQVFDELMRRHRPVRTYTDCFGHGLALEGSVGAMVDFDLRLWDIAATQVLIPEAGGKFVCWRQRGANAVEARYDILFGKPRVVDWILRTLQFS